MRDNTEIHNGIEARVRELEEFIIQANLDYKIDVQISTDIENEGVVSTFNESSNWDASWC